MHAGTTQDIRYAGAQYKAMPWLNCCEPPAGSRTPPLWARDVGRCRL